MRPFLQLFCILFWLPPAAQAQNQNSVIKAQAMAMTNALIKKDYTTFSRYVHPKLVAMAGGQAKLRQRIDTANAMAKQFGAEIKHIRIGEPAKIVSYKNELQTTVPQSTEMATAMGSIIFESTLIAVSGDAGKTWQFLDTSLYGMKDIRKAVPELSPQLTIPPPRQPRLIPNQQ